jgi:hypothetical protein
MAKTRAFWLFAALLVACAALFGPASGWANGFFSNIEDLPVMPGLAEMPGSAVTFDKPEGRLAEVAAAGAVTKDAVLTFYARTLLQLGWRETAAGRFAREGERLTLAFGQKGGRLTVRFSLSPG